MYAILEESDAYLAYAGKVSIGSLYVYCCKSHRNLHSRLTPKLGRRFAVVKRREKQSTGVSKKETTPGIGLQGHDGVLTQPSAEEEVSAITITLGADKFDGIALGTECNRVYTPLASAARVMALVLDQRHAGAADYNLIVPQQLYRQNQKT